LKVKKYEKNLYICGFKNELIRDMKVEDLKILRQLSPETQGKIEITITVRELFTCVKYITADEKQKPAKVVVQHKALVTKVKLDVTEQVLPVVPVVPIVPIVPIVPVVPVVLESEAPEEKEEKEEMEEMEAPLYYTTQEVADKCNVTANSVRGWVRKGLLVAHHKKGSIFYYAKSDVEWVQHR
jgi:hypothetical protein